MTTPTRQPTSAQQIHQRLLAAAPLTERRERLAGVHTAIFEGGQGPPLVLLHGQGEFWGVWLHVLGDLVATHRVIVADLPGHGGSLEFAGKLDADRLVQWVDELVDATCASPPVVIGHLLGGAIAARYAVEHGDRLAHLVLVDSMGLNWYRPSPRLAIPLVRLMVRPTRKSLDGLFDKCFSDFDKVAQSFGELWDDVRDYALDRAQTDENAAALQTMMPRVGLPPVPPRDRDRIAVPVALIHGRDDLQVPLRAAERASQRHGWPLHVIEECRDEPAAEQPEAFIAALHEALGIHGQHDHDHDHDHNHDQHDQEA